VRAHATEFPRRKYDKKIPLSSAKISDLKELCKTVTPTEHHSFYDVSSPFASAHDCMTV